MAVAITVFFLAPALLKAAAASENEVYEKLSPSRSCHQGYSASWGPPISPGSTQRWLVCEKCEPPLQQPCLVTAPTPCVSVHSGKCDA